MNKVALIVIYNHQYTPNIEVIEKIYADRFSTIYHLMPFYDGSKENVIPVYESSYYFQGYVSQGLKSFFKQEFTHYFFVADDLVLNPVINESNYSDYLKLKPSTSFIPEIISLHEKKDFWPRIAEAFNWKIDIPGLEIKDQLPNYENALRLLSYHNLTIEPLNFSQLWEAPRSLNGIIQALRTDLRNYFRYGLNKLRPRRYHLSYPLIGSYSDLFVVSSQTIVQFSHYCGVFSAAKLFVEIGLPTALLLSTKEVITEQDLELQGKALWVKEDFEILDKYNYSLPQLLDNFPINHLYLHPIKLSKWKTKR